MKFRISMNKNIKHVGKMCVIFLLHHMKNFQKMVYNGAIILKKKKKGSTKAGEVGDVRASPRAYRSTSL